MIRNEYSYAKAVIPSCALTIAGYTKIGSTSGSKDQIKFNVTFRHWYSVIGNIEILCFIRLKLYSVTYNNITAAINFCTLITQFQGFGDKIYNIWSFCAIRVVLLQCVKIC